jgi:NAD(P)-dependent dehydrogenase (short-subunit alcohol dehydrogenase family)
MTATGDLEGKVAIVTGAANGIGLSIATRFVAEGARVVIADIDAAGQSVAAELGERAAFITTDVSDPAQARALVDFTIRHFGGLHVLCNNAGVSGGLRRFLDDDLRDFERVVAVDLYGVMACSRSAARHMAGQGGGAIVNISSGAGITPGIGMLPYRAAKAGVVQFTRCLAVVEVGEHGIRANCIAPANIATEINAAFGAAGAGGCDGDDVRCNEPRTRPGPTAGAIGRR